MASRFSTLADILRQQPSAERQQPVRRDAESERRQIKEDMEFGRRTAQKQAAAADPDAAYLAHCRAQALRIVQAGARARGLPVPTCLEQDRDDAPGPGDDTPVDDEDHKTKKSKKRAKPAVADDDEEAEADEPRDPVDEGGDDFDSDDEKKHKAIALRIINAGRRARGLPLLAKLDQD
jgi:hypothetical protein